MQEAARSCSAPASSRARSEIDSEPDGARVAIDNAYLGITPLISPTLLAGKHNVRVEADGHFPWMSRVEVRPGQELQIKLTPENLPRAARGPPTGPTAPRRWPGLGRGGSFFGVLSQLKPSGDTRQEAMQDLDQKREFATAANISFGAAAVFGAVSLYYFLRYHDDIFGRTEHYEETP